MNTTAKTGRIIQVKIIQAFVSEFSQGDGFGILRIHGKKDPIPFTIDGHREMATDENGQVIFTNRPGKQFTMGRLKDGEEGKFLPEPINSCSVAVLVSETVPVIWAYWFEYQDVRRDAARQCTTVRQSERQPVQSPCTGQSEQAVVEAAPKATPKVLPQPVVANQRPTPAQQREHQSALDVLGAAMDTGKIVPNESYVPAKHRGKGTRKPEVSKYQMRQGAGAQQIAA